MPGYTMPKAYRYQWIVFAAALRSFSAAPISPADDLVLIRAPY